MSHSITYLRDNNDDFKHLRGDALGNLRVADDNVISALNDMKEHTGLSSTRLLNIANHLTQDGLGGGTSHGVMMDGIDSSLNTIESNSTLIASRLDNIQVDLAANEVLLTTIDTAIDLTNTKLTAQATHNTNILAKNTELETTCNGIETLITTANTYDINHNVSSQNLATHTALLDNAAFNANSYTTTIDLLVSGTLEIYRDLTIYGKYADASAPRFHFSYSDDDSTYFIDPIYHTESITDGSNKHFRMSYENIPFRYVRVYCDTTASAAACYLYWVATKHR